MRSTTSSISHHAYSQCRHFHSKLDESHNSITALAQKPELDKEAAIDKVSEFWTFLRNPKSFSFQKINFLYFFQSIGIDGKKKIATIGFFE
jgi:hypothetical protein